VVVGGGKVAERKTLSLLKAGADVTVISPEITRRLEKEKSKASIRHIPRKYKTGDLKGASLVVSATDSRAENIKVSKEAKRRNIPVNVVDTPDLCSFIVPSTVRRGPLTIAISTSGASPAMAKAIRKELEKLYGREFGVYLGKIRRLRERKKSGIKDKKEREKLFKTLASGDILKKLRLRRHNFKHFYSP